MRGGGSVISFEPIPLNCNVIREHVRENDIQNIR